MRKNSSLIYTLPLAIIVFIFVFYEYGYLNFKAELDQERERTSLKVETYKRYTAAIAEIPSLETQKAELTEKRKSLSNIFFEGQTHTVASSALQDNIKNILTARGATIQGQRIDKPTDLGRYKVITVNTNAFLPDAKLLPDILYAIQTSMPRMVIKEFELRVQNYRDPRQLYLNITTSGITEGK